jgi:tetratricopeptide (TPR) repeat protein
VTWLAGVLPLLSGTWQYADEPAPVPPAAKPPWRRLLQGNEARQAAEQEKHLAQLQEAGQFNEALKVAEALAALRAKAQGDDHWQAANARWAVEALRRVLRQGDPASQEFAGGFALQREADRAIAKGRYREAQPLREQVLALRRQVLGEDHPHTATAYHNLAFNVHGQGRYAEAAKGLAKALAIYRKALGEDHPNTATCYNYLALTLSAQRRYAEAAEGFAKALAIWRKTLGEDHPNTARSYNNMAANLTQQGRSGDAAAGFAKALAIRRKVLGEDHPDTATSYNNVAANLEAQGRYAEAAGCYAKALAIYRKALGEEHPETTNGYHGLASSLHAQGRYEEAESALTTAATHFGTIRLRLAPSGLERAAKTGDYSPLPLLAAVLARNGKPEAAWQRFEEGLARGTWDDLSARLRRPPAEQVKQAEYIARLERLDHLLEKALTAKDASPQQDRQRKELLTQRRQAQDDFDAFAHQLEQTHGPAAGQVFARAEIQQFLPADAALLGWLDLPGAARAADPDGEHWAVLLRAAGAPVWLRLRGSGPDGAWADADTRLPAELRESLHAPRGAWQPLAQRLRAQRLEPLAKVLAAGNGQPAVRHLIVLPSTALAGVPVEVFAEGYMVS